MYKFDTNCSTNSSKKTVRQKQFDTSSSTKTVRQKEFDNKSSTKRPFDKKFEEQFEKMANRTVKDAHTVKGTNPQYLIEKIIRMRIYDSKYWKEECFALTGYF